MAVTHLQAHSSDDGGGGRPDGPARILLVDDDADIRMMLRMYLRLGDVEVVGEAGDGSEAVQLAEELQPDVVLLDIMMPVMSGHEALPRLQAVAPGIMVVMLSALAAQDQEQEALDAGAFAYVEKTSLEVDFAGRVEQMLADFRGGRRQPPASPGSGAA